MFDPVALHVKGSKKGKQDRFKEIQREGNNFVRIICVRNALKVCSNSFPC